METVSLTEDRTWIKQYLDKSYKQDFQEVKSHQIMKLEKIKAQSMKDQAHYSPVKIIININKHQLTTCEKTILNKSLNFATTIKWIPYLDLLAPIVKATFKNSKGPGRWT